MRRIIWLLIVVVLILITIGILMLASASSVKQEGASFFWVRQLQWLAIAACGAVAASRFNYQHLQRLAVPAAIISAILLVLVRIPGIGHESHGSWRWLKLGRLTMQPSEAAKLALIMLFAWWLARNQRRIDELKRGILIPFGMLGCFAFLLVIEPDFGTTMLVSAVVVCMMFLGGVSLTPLLAIGLAGLFGVLTMIFQNPERMSRILAFLDPQRYEQSKAWQLANSLRAFASGNLAGVGYGNSLQKYDYLPEAHTDFIFPIIAEEWGLIVSLVVVMLYLIFFVLGLSIALKTRDDFGRLLAFGITLMISIQALINFAVVTGCVPTKGLALPFISYGGSSLVISCVMVGILINIAQTNMKSSSGRSTSLFKDRMRKA